MKKSETRDLKPAQWLGVFCGSYRGNVDDVHLLAAELGAAMAKANVGLVYGGGGIGVMGTIADALLAAGGHAIGVVPTNLMETEMAHPSLDELLVVASMHDRKRAMYERSDAFCALPGGFGTLEELFEAATWTKLGLHSRPKPVLLLDRNGFWTDLERFLDDVMAAGFIKSDDRGIIRRVETVDEVLASLAS
ncbi:MAG: TIGR00730 family Rossman fold protein [Actinomycetota bacterium]|nr:TIGR00730 family Rossman fold protein [Actinomycetota bacterium]